MICLANRRVIALGWRVACNKQLSGPRVMGPTCRLRLIFDRAHGLRLRCWFSQKKKRGYGFFFESKRGYGVGREKIRITSSIL